MTDRLVTKWLDQVKASPDNAYLALDTTATPINTAKRMNLRQWHYSLLHHLKRVSEFENMARTARLDVFDLRLLEQSKYILSSQPILANNSIDMNNSAYLSELDTFAACLP